MRFEFPAIRAACLMVACLFFSALGSIVADDVVYPPRTISAMIVDDGRFSDRYFGDEHTGVPAVEEVPFFFLSGESVEEVRVPYGALSRLHRYRGPLRLDFYHSRPSIDPLDPKPSIGASVQLPPGSGEVLLLFFTEDFDRRTYRVIPISASSRDFPVNSARIFNLSAVPVAYELEGHRGQVQRNASTSLNLNVSEPFQRLRLAQYDEEGERWRPFFDRYLQIIDGYRSTFLILPRPGSEGSRVMVKTIADNYRLRQRNLERRDPLEEEE